MESPCFISRRIPAWRLLQGQVDPFTQDRAKTRELMSPRTLDEIPAVEAGGEGRLSGQGWYDR
eukprot:6038726-Pyramimonas_sp.AAC.1